MTQALCFTVVGIHLVALFSASATLADDNPLEVFDYPANMPLSDTKAEGGWSSGWKANADLSEDLSSDYTEVEGSLTSDAFEQHGLKPAGGKFSTEEQGEGLRMYRGINREIDWGSDSETYLSYLVRWDGNHPTKSSRIQLGFGDRSLETDPKIGFGRSYVSLNGTGNADELNLMVRVNGATETGEKAYPAGPVYLVVVRISTYEGSMPDQMSAVVFGPNDEVPADEPTDWELSVSKPTNGKSDALEFNTQLYFQKRLTGFDELRFGDSWGAVTAAK